MNESKKQFVDRLLAADTPSPDAREKYEKEVRAMLEKTLSPRQRGVYLVVAVLLVLQAAVIVGFVASTLASPPLKPEPEIVKFVVFYFVVSALALAVIGGVLFWGFWKGAVNRRTSRGWATGIGVAYIGLLGWLFMLMARYFPEVFREDLRVLGLVLLLYAAVAWVRHNVAQAEMKTAERLLEIELRLAELGENLKPSPRPEDPAPPA
jgi:hypothetical protein